MVVPVCSLFLSVSEVDCDLDLWLCHFLTSLLFSYRIYAYTVGQSYTIYSVKSDQGVH